MVLETCTHLSFHQDYTSLEVGWSACLVHFRSSALPSVLSSAGIDHTEAKQVKAEKEEERGQKSARQKGTRTARLVRKEVPACISEASRGQRPPHTASVREGEPGKTQTGWATEARDEKTISSKSTSAAGEAGG